MIHSWWMRERLQALLDGELSDARRAAVAGHLQQCPRCAATYRQLADGDRLLAAHSPQCPLLSPAAAEALFERALVDARLSRGGPWRGMTMLAWGFAALLVIAASGAAAWWRRPDLLDDTNRWRPSLLGRHDADGDGAKAAQVVADNKRFESETRVPDQSNKRPSAPVRRDGRRHGGESAPASAGAPGPVEPRRRPRGSSRRLVATLPPSSEARLRWQDDAAVPLRTAGAGPDGSLAQPGVEARRVPDQLADEQNCDREAVRLVSAALDGESSAIRAVAAALEEQPAIEPKPGGLSTGINPGVQPPELMVAQEPLPWQDEPPEAHVADAMLPPPQLLVLVSNAPAPSPVTVTMASEDMPGFAQAVTCRPDAAGRDTWMQATATTNLNGTQTALVMLGDEVWNW